jgi:transcription factor C subunit 7
MEAHQSPTGVRLDFPLTAYGHAQAHDLATFLALPNETAPYPVPERVISSPYYRCIATAAPTARALGLPIAVDHGVMEWYPPAREGTGLHPRPALTGPKDVAGFFPDSEFDLEYNSTNYPSRLGEKMPDLFNRIDTFVDAWIGRMDDEGVKTAVIFGHAATVIALGRALTGDRQRDFVAGCATTSLYKRKGDGRVESWDCVYTGKADYMPGGVESDWDVSIPR